MSTIKHILVPTDGSEGALKAASFAGDLARSLNARVSLLIVQSDELVIASAWGASGFPAGPPQGTLSVEEIRNMLEQRVREKELPDTVKALGKLDAAPGLTTTWGQAAEEISRFAADSDVDLIIIGSHGRSGIKKALLGSVSHAVANQAPCPVTIVR